MQDFETNIDDGKTHKSWCFTLNNYTDLEEKVFEHIECNYIVYGREFGESGTPHLQGFITFKQGKRFAAMKKLQKRANWSIAKVPEAAANYCMKDGDFEIRDNRKKKGERTDLTELSNMITGGSSLQEIAVAQPGNFLRYHRGIERMIEICKKEHELGEFNLAECCKYTKKFPLTLHGTANVIEGEPGTGKTQYALAHFERPLLVSHIDKLLEFNPDYHDGIVFDDMDFSHWHRTHQIHLVDWSNSREIHCRYRVAKIPKFTIKVFVCNDFPFKRDAAILRRITTVFFDTDTDTDTDVRER